MSAEKDSEILRDEILEKTKAYYKARFGEEKKFVGGKSKISYAGRVFDENEIVNLVDSSLDFWLTHGRYSQCFEKELAAYVGSRYCFLVGSGSSANLLAFMALTSPRLGKRKIGRGDEVITVAAGFPTTVAPIVQYGAIPVFVDVDADTVNIDVTLLEQAVSERTKAVVLAHTLGNPFDVDQIKSFCRKHDLWLIEDNCDSLGSTYDGKRTGTFGDIATSSFYPPHHMTMGEGGAVYTNSRELSDIVLSLRDWGRDCRCPSGADNLCNKRFEHSFGELPHGYDHKYVYSHFGYNFKATDMQAAIGCAQLQKLPQFIRARKNNWRLMNEGLHDLKEHFLFQKPTMKSDPSWFGFLITIKPGAPFKRESIIEYLESKNIQTRLLFAGNLIKQPCFDEMRRNNNGYRVASSLINTDTLMSKAFWLGVYPGMKDSVHFVIDQIREYVRSGDYHAK